MQVVVIHEGAVLGNNRVASTPPIAWEGPIIDIVERLQHTEVDLVIAGHTHRIANTVVGRIPIAEGVNAGGSYSVAQMVIRGNDVEWTSPSTRVAKNIGVANRPDVQAIVDAANAETAVLRNQVIGTQAIDIRRDLTRLNESAMGNLVADAMLDKYPGIDAALTNSGGLRQDILITPPSASEAAGEITWGEVFAVLPFGNRTVIETLTGDQLRAALLNGFSPVCNSAIATGRFPQVAGLRLRFHCEGTTPVIDEMSKALPGEPATPIGPADTVRIVTNDFMFTWRRRLHRAGRRHRRAATRRRPARDRHRVHHRQLAGRPGGRRSHHPRRPDEHPRPRWRTSPTVARVDVRSITADETNDFRRAVRAGFGTAETVDDEELALASCDPLDRCVATFDRGVDRRHVASRSRRR